MMYVLVGDVEDLFSCAVRPLFFAVHRFFKFAHPYPGSFPQIQIEDAGNDRLHCQAFEPGDVGKQTSDHDQQGFVGGFAHDKAGMFGGRVLPSPR